MVLNDYRLLKEELLTSVSIVSRFHERIRGELIYEDKGDIKKHYEMLKILFSLEKIVRAVIYHKTRIYELTAEVDFKGFMPGQYFKLRDESIEFEFDAFLFRARTFFDIYARLVELTVVGKVTSGRWKKIINILGSASSSKESLIEELIKQLSDERITSHLKEYMGENSKPTRRDQLAHRSVLNYTMCEYGLDVNGKKYFKFPSEGGRDLWGFSNETLEVISLIIEKLTDLLTKEYLSDNGEKIELTGVKLEEKNRLILKELEKDVILRIP